MSTIKTAIESAVRTTATLYGDVRSLPEGVVSKELLERIEQVSSENNRILTNQSQSPEECEKLAVAAVELAQKNKKIISEIANDLKDSPNEQARTIARIVTDQQGAAKSWNWVHIVAAVAISVVAVGVVVGGIALVTSGVAATGAASIAGAASAAAATAAEAAAASGVAGEASAAAAAAVGYTVMKVMK